MKTVDKHVINENEKKWGQLLGAILDVIENELKNNNITPELAQKIATKITISLSNYFGGRSIYLPTRERIKIALRNKMIYQEFDGKNITELMIKYKLTNSTIYKIIREERKLNRKINNKVYLN